MKIIKSFTYLILFGAVAGTSLGLTASKAFGQIIVDQNQYKSPADEIFHIERLSVSAFYDNAEGIYSRPLERHLIDKLSQNHRFNFVAASSDATPQSPEALVRDPELAKAFGEKEKVDAFFSARITSFPTGLQISVYFFLTKDGAPLIQGELKGLKNDSIEFLKGQLDLLVAQVMERLPFAGQVMSRDGVRVTLNLGTKDGVQKGQELTAIQFLAVNRHPKHKFLINSEKEVIGKVKILKSEPTLSFGAIIFEKEKGIINRGTKINTLSEVHYGDINLGIGDDPNAGQTPSGGAFGENPREWKPLDRPAFGTFTAKAGLMRFQHNMDLEGVGPISGKTSFAPVVDLAGELWVTSEWTAHAQLKQGLIMIDNPRSGSTPSELSQSLTAMELAFGYRFRFGPEGPSSYAEPFLGYFSHNLYSDSTSPETFTSMKYSGFKLGVRGEFPVTEDQIWRAGGKISFALQTNLSESPVTSGSDSSDSSVQFQFYASKALSARLRALGSVDFEQFSSNFSGVGTRAESADSSSLRYMNFTGGVSYAF